MPTAHPTFPKPNLTANTVTLMTHFSHFTSSFFTHHFCFHLPAFSSLSLTTHSRGHARRRHHQHLRSYADAATLTGSSRHRPPPTIFIKSIVFHSSSYRSEISFHFFDLLHTTQTDLRFFHWHHDSRFLSSVPPRQGTESASTVQNAPTVSNLTKKRSATSDVWNYFVSLGVGEDGKPRAKCKGCDEVYIAGGSSHGTSSLKRHIPKCSKLNSYHNVGNMLIDHARKLRSRKISQKVLRSLTAMAIIRHDLPFSFVEYEGVREMFKYCNPDVKFITRNTAVADVWKVYKSKKESLKQELVDPTTCQSKLDVVRKKLFELFNAYASNSSSSSSSSSSQCQIQPPNIPTNSETRMRFSTFTALMDFDSEIVSQLGKSQLELYLEEAKLEFKFHKDLDVLRYWKDNRGRFPYLSLMAFDILSIPITTVALESAFSIGSQVLKKYRSCLLPEKVQALLCTRNWLIGFNVEEANASFSSTPNEVDSPSIAESNIT
ncbi:putative AC transposase [Senna tora]|uniref:Putative AC transposase n=1 Tax=Senna tora TaxID=362788 RepID=A0A834WFR7_9FABA|nr:putative AC transposase [Senna tora]